MHAWGFCFIFFLAKGMFPLVWFWFCIRVCTGSTFFKLLASSGEGKQRDTLDPSLFISSGLC